MKRFGIVFIVLLLLSIFSPVSTFAEKGDFYEKHKSEFDRLNLPDEYIDTMKAYDYETNSFECGMTKIACKLSAFQLGWGTGLAKFSAQAVQGILMDPQQITKDPAFVRFKGYFDSMSTTLLTLFLIWQIMVMMMRRFADPDDYPQAMNQKMLQVLGGGILLGLYSTIFTQILWLQNEMTSAVLTSGVSEEQLVLMVLLYSPGYSILFSIAMALIFIVYSVAILYRFVSLGFFYAIGPVAITTIVNEEFNYFQIWLKFIVNNVVTLFLQSMAFAFSVAAMTQQFAFTKSLPNGLDVVGGFILAMVFCFFALVIPSILGNLGSSTGTGRLLGRVTRYAVMRR